MNTLESTSIRSPALKDEECAKFTITDPTVPFIFHDVIQQDKQYTLSFYSKSDSNGTVRVADKTFAITTDWQECIATFTAQGTDLKMHFDASGIYYLYHAQLEDGNVDTDWTPAPEDAEEEIISTKTIATQTADKFEWLVASGDSASTFTLTDRMATLIADTISLNGDVKVTGDMLIDGSVTAAKINVGDLFAQDIVASGSITGITVNTTKGTIGGWNIAEKCLYSTDNVLAKERTLAIQNITPSVFTQVSNSGVNCDIEVVGGLLRVTPKTTGHAKIIVRFQLAKGDYKLNIYSGYTNYHNDDQICGTYSLYDGDGNGSFEETIFEKPTGVSGQDSSYTFDFSIRDDGDTYYEVEYEMPSATVGEVYNFRAYVLGNGKVYTGENPLSGIPENYAIALKDTVNGEVTFPFYLTSDGKMYCSNAEIDGKINAVSGKIGAVNITQTGLDITKIPGDGYEYHTVLRNQEGNDRVLEVVRATEGQKDWKSMFYVRYDGKVYAENAEIKGNITATNLEVKDCLYIYDDNGNKINAISSEKVTAGSSKELWIGEGTTKVWVPGYSFFARDLTVYGGSSLVTISPSGRITSTLETRSYLNGNKGNAIISSDAAAGTYVMLAKMNATDGVFTMGCGNNSFRLNYTDNETISAGTNSVTYELSMNSTGTLYLRHPEDTKADIRIRNSLRDMALTISASGTAGIYINDISDWLIYSQNDKDTTHVLGKKYVLIRATGFGIRVGDGFTSGNNVVCPITSSNTAKDNSVYLGASSSRWISVYAKNGSIQTSDERDKNIIGDINQQYLDLFMSLKPILYRWKDGDDTKTHMGFGAQSTEAAAIRCGIAPGELAAVSHDHWDEPGEDGRTDRYGLNYAEITALTVPVVQKNKKSIQALESQIETLKYRLDQAYDEIEKLKKAIHFRNYRDHRKQ